MHPEGISSNVSNDSNYVDIKISCGELNGKQIDLLLTPDMAKSGVLASTEFKADWTVTDLEWSGACWFEAQFEDGLPKDVVLHLNDRNGIRIAEINKVSPVANVSCFDIADGEILLVRLPSGFL